jgi:hypothetical protein
MAHATSFDFYQNFAFLRFVDGNFFDSVGSAWFLDDDGAGGFGELWGHFVGWWIELVKVDL